MSREVLLIEADRALRDAIADALTSYGYVVDTARDGGEGVSKIFQHAFDVVIADLPYDLDGYNGDGRVLRQSRKGALNVPVICIASDRESALRDAVLDAGAAAYLTKPVTAAELHQAIKGVLLRD